MKKIDKLILSAFLGPFVMTFLVVVFILLNIHMLKYFDDIIGKDLGLDVIGTLLFYFAIFNTPASLPLAVLLSSLIAFGNLGEHFELTAIKSLGISLTRALFPIFIFVIFVTGFAFYTGNYLVPKAALEAYSLLYDIKQKKPALDLKEGAFTSSIPDISIKVNDKLPDNKTIRDVIIYDHRNKSGNKEVIIADSGLMTSILNDRYLKLELFDGYNYREGAGEQEVSGRNDGVETMSKTQFHRSTMVFDLSSFELERTDKKWFQGNRIMRNLKELDVDMDSIERDEGKQMLSLFEGKEAFFRFHRKSDSAVMSPVVALAKKRRDSVLKVQNQTFDPSSRLRRYVFVEEITPEKIEFSNKVIVGTPFVLSEYSQALATARNAQSQLQNVNSQILDLDTDYKVFQVQWHKILASAVACMAMFLIGAPLGALIRKGGLGIPVLASIVFFILFYVLSLLGEKWSKGGTLPVVAGMWMANAILFSIGFVFLLQARRDARIFDSEAQWMRVAKVVRAVGRLVGAGG
jgi:lipopolysaccharide export system permease protein